MSSITQIVDFKATLVYKDFIALIEEDLENTRDRLEDPNDDIDGPQINFFRGKIDGLKEMRKYFDYMIEALEEQNNEESENESK